MHHGSLSNASLTACSSPRIHSSYENSPAFSDEILPIRKTICLWRSIIISAINEGKTYLPYAFYIRTLRLGAFQSDFLSEIAGNRGLRDLFFQGEMGRFVFELQSKRTLRTTMRHLDHQAIVIAIGHTISTFLTKSPNIIQKPAALEELEGVHIPSDLLNLWVSCIPRLSALRLQQGSAIHPELGTTISNSKLHMFRDIRCFYCYGSDVDESMASFFCSLPANQLHHFAVLSQNSLGKKALTTLAQKQGRNLQSFALQVSMEALSHIPAINTFPALQYLSLDFFPAPPDYIRKIGRWISECPNLTRLELRNVDKLGNILSPILGSPLIRLTSLSVDRSSLGGDEFFDALGKQVDLEVLEITTPQEDYSFLSQEQEQALKSLIASVMKLHRIKTLELLCMYLHDHELCQLINALPLLEHLSWTNEAVDDASLRVLKRARNLKSVTSHGTSYFTFEGLDGFIQSLAARGSRGGQSTQLSNPHWGFKLIVLNQHGVLEFKLPSDDHNSLQANIASRLGGTFFLGYIMDDDELHEDDFSE